MQRLRATAFFARLVLAWFALTVGVSMASPLVRPTGVQWICGGGAVKLAPQDGGGAPAVKLTLDCALCAPAVAPPPPVVAAMPVVRQVHAVPEVPVREISAHRAELRPPVRGPPATRTA